MPREYIPKSWTHGKGAWNRTKGLLQDYDRLCREREDILHGGYRPPDGQPRSAGAASPTEQKALRLIRNGEDLEAIDQASVEMRGRLGDKVGFDFNPVRAFWSYDYYNYQHTRQGEGDCGPCRRTWHNYKVRLLTMVAKRAKII